jgi:hypothetical protein
VNVSSLQPRRHEPPAGWTPPVFEAVTDALAAALVASWRRTQASAREDGEEPTR